MKPTALIIVTLAPLLAAAADGAIPDHQQLRDDLKVTALIGAGVQAGDGNEVGVVEDVLLDRAGQVVSLVVQRDGSAADAITDAGTAAADAVDEVRRAADRRWERATNERERPTRDSLAAEDGTDAESGFDVDRAGTEDAGDAFAAVNWSGIVYDSEAEVVRLTGETESLQPIQYGQATPQGGEVRASHLVGMEVNLTDEESFGEVEDVLIDPASGKASALVVDSMEFFDKQRYALPAEFGALNAEEEELTLQLTQQQMEDMREFEMDADESAADQPGNQE